MKGLFIEDGAVRYRDDLPAPATPDGEVPVRVLTAGVCATDLALARGYMGFRGVPGHEFVGVALAGPLAGQRVVGEINAACGECATCRAGNGRHCPTRSVLGILARSGAFAEHTALPSRNLHQVPDSVSTAAATFVEPLAAAFEIAEQVQLVPEERALVCGDGRLGLLCAQVLARSGVEVSLAGRHPERAERVGLVVSNHVHLDRTPGQGERFDLVVEATGDPGVLQRALAWVRPQGVLILKSTSERAAPIDLAPLVVDEIRLIGSRCGPFEPALAALSGGEVQVEPMIEARYPLEDGPQALQHAARAGVLKVLIEIGTE